MTAKLGVCDEECHHTTLSPYENKIGGYPVRINESESLFYSYCGNVTFLFRTKGHVSYREVGCLAIVQALRQTAPASCAGVLPARRLRVPPSYPRVLLRASRVLVLTRKVTSRLASLYPLSSPNSVCFFSFFFFSSFLFSYLSQVAGSCFVRR